MYELHLSVSCLSLSSTILLSTSLLISTLPQTIRDNSWISCENQEFTPPFYFLTQNRYFVFTVHAIFLKRVYFWRGIALCISIPLVRVVEEPFSTSGIEALSPLCPLRLAPVPHFASQTIPPPMRGKVPGALFMILFSERKIQYLPPDDLDQISIFA